MDGFYSETDGLEAYTSAALTSHGVDFEASLRPSFSYYFGVSLSLRIEKGGVVVTYSLVLYWLEEGIVP